MTRPLRLLCPDQVDLAEVGALLARLRRTVPGLPVGTRDRPESVAVPLVLSAYGSPPAGASTARSLGPHPLLVAAAADRVRAVLGGRDPAETAVLLVAPGAPDAGSASGAEANAESAKVARLLQEGRGYAFVEHAYLSDARPDVPTGLARCRALGARHVMVLPYALMHPAFVAAVRVECVHASDTVVAGDLGDSAELAELVVERYHEVLQGDVRMNCDACAYRKPVVLNA